MKKGFMRQAFFYLLIFVLVVALFQTLSQPADETHEINYYPDFVGYIEEGQVEEVVLTGNEVEATLTDGTKVETYKPEGENLTARLIEHNIPFEPRPEPEPGWWSTSLIYMLPFVLIVGLIFFFMRQAQGGGNRLMNFGKSKAKMYQGEHKNIGFSQVAGADEEKKELEEIVEFLKDPRKFIDLGARIPKGVLLVGPAGTGKTLLGKAVAGEAGVPFFSISGSDFVEMFVGVGASRVRDLFQNAKKSSPCIIFIDEIDAVGRQRGAGLGGGHDEKEQTLNQLLVEMDGFDVNEGIIILAATNRPDILDPALLRPGRFDRQIAINIPDIKGREEILGVHAKNKPLDEEADLKVVARRTPGFTGADLENLINEAALLAARRGKNTIGMPELEEAVDRVMAGTEKKSRVITDFEKEIVAYHEAGHALVGYLLPRTDPVHKVSIIPRGKAGGFTLMLPEDDRYYMTRSELLDRVSTLLAGRVAEQVVFDEVSTGAQNDLERATSIVRQMIMEHGMSEELGPITLGRKQQEVFLGRDLARDRDYSEEIARSIDREIKQMVDFCYHQAEEMISNNREKLELLSEALKERETLDSLEIKAIIEGKDEAEVLAEARQKELEAKQSEEQSEKEE